MRLKIISAALLTICFGWLAILSGAIPVMAKDAAGGDAPVIEDTEVIEEAEDTLPPAEVTPPPEAEEPEPDIPPAVHEEPAPDPEAPEDPRTVTVTITGETLDNDTYYNVEPEELLAEDLSLTLPAEGYQILIVHTHATEAYTPAGEDVYEPTEGDEYRTADPAYSVVRVGDELAAAYEGYGLRVLHDTTLHDSQGYSGSYVRSGEAVEEYLAAYPGIRVVIDLHRDAIGEDDVSYRTIADIDGVEAAQLMFVMGTDVNLDHPDWQENLKLALTLQAAADARYPTLMRPIVLCDYRYNQQLSPGSLLLEVGASANTLQEALEGVRRFAEVTGPVLASLVEE